MTVWPAGMAKSAPNCQNDVADAEWTEYVLRTIDALDRGASVLVAAPTGSGKTLAFGVPLVDLIRREGEGPRALVLAPTRELASL